MYNSLILPDLYFCITLWGFNTNIIFKLQKKAIRNSNSKFNAHTEPLFKELRLLKISDIFNLQCLKFHFNVTHRQTPVFVFTFFIQNNTAFTLKTTKTPHSYHRHTHNCQTLHQKVHPKVTHKHSNTNYR